MLFEMGHVDRLTGTTLSLPTHHQNRIITSQYQAVVTKFNISLVLDIYTKKVSLSQAT